MKIRPLPPTDLARVAVLPLHMQRPALEQVGNGGGTLSYKPTRDGLPDIVNRQPGPFKSVRTALSIIEAGLNRLSRSDKEFDMNLIVTRSIYKYCVEKSVSARELEAYPISFANGPPITCWTPALFVYPSHLTVPFFDMRRKYGLTYLAETFVMSVQHLALRVNNPDYTPVQFEILRLVDSRTRSVRVLPEDGRTLYSYDEVERMISVTYRIWNDVLADRDETIKKSGHKSDGSLL